MSPSAVRPVLVALEREGVRMRVVVDDAFIVVDMLRCNEVDHDGVRRDLGELEGLLDQPDLVRSFDALAVRAHRG